MNEMTIPDKALAAALRRGGEVTLVSADVNGVEGDGISFQPVPKFCQSNCQLVSTPWPPVRSCSL